MLLGFLALFLGSSNGDGVGLELEVVVETSLDTSLVVGGYQSGDFIADLFRDGE